MKLYGKARQRARYKHWETWAALALFATCVAAAAYLGGHWGYRWVLFVAAVIVGTVITYQVKQYVDRQYNQ